MSPVERAFWQRVSRKAAAMQPDLAAAVLRAFAALRQRIGEQAFARLIARGDVDAALALLSDSSLNLALAPLQQQLRDQLAEATAYWARVLPILPPPPSRGTIAFGFDVLNPQTITAIRTLEDRAMTTLKADIRETVRQRIAAGLAAGEHPLAVARDLRAVLGLAPNQELAVRNLRRELETGQYASAADRALLDRRFNLAKLAGLQPAERAARIDRIVGAYRKSFVAYHAETVSRTATLDALKIGQRLTLDAAVGRGDVDGGRLMKQWVHFDPQPDPRPEHIYMASLPPVPYDEPYENGANWAGEDSPWNCHCLDKYTLAAAAVM